MRRALALLTLMLLSRLAPAAEPDVHTRHLAQAARIWGAIKFLDPWIYTHDVDWDAALIDALPKVRLAKSEDEYVAALGSMLHALGDPLTKIKASAPAPDKTPQEPLPEALWSWPAPGVLAIDLRGPGDKFWQRKKELLAQLEKANLVIFDLRVRQQYDGFLAEGMLGQLTPLIMGRALQAPGWTTVQHSGYRPQRGTSSGGYATTLAQSPQDFLVPAPGARARRAAFICNALSNVPDAALAMQSAGESVILAEQLTNADVSAGLTTLPLDETHSVVYRFADVLPVSAAPRIDVALPAHSSAETAIARALAALRALPKKPSHSTPPLAPRMRWTPDKTYAEMKSPSTEYRLLALFRLWNVIDRFYPDIGLIDHDWDAQLIEFLPRFEAPESQEPYRRLVAELAARIDDGHVGVQGGEDPLLVRPASVPFFSRIIEGQPVVTRLFDDAPKDLSVGDVIESVDGRRMKDVMGDLRRYVAASNAVSKEQNVARLGLRGAEGSVATLVVRGSDDKPRELKIPRRVINAPVSYRTGDVYKILDGNIGYVDLDRLQQGETDAMFAKLKATRAIIFDMRGYPSGTAWTIAPRINTRHAKIGARFSRMMVVANGDRDQRITFAQSLADAHGDYYSGKTFMLIDERTMSQAEHTALFFEAANGTRFIGSQTAGANGDVTNLFLPGALSVSFTGHEVRHADGRQLQRVGVHPDVEVHPTIKGIRSGRDEVLERALELARAK